MAKIYVKVTAEHDENGKTKPLALTWTDGKQYGIDRVVVSRILRTFVDGVPRRFQLTSATVST